jgi:hypothetical protein
VYSNQMWMNVYGFVCFGEPNMQRLTHDLQIFAWSATTNPILQWGGTNHMN